MAEVFADAGHECVWFASFGGDGEEFGFFVDDDEFRVFVDDTKAAVEMLFGSAAWGVAAAAFEADFQLVAWDEESAGLNFDGAVDGHAVVVEESDNEAAGASGEVLHSAICASICEGGIGEDGEMAVFERHAEDSCQAGWMFESVFDECSDCGE
ncbi:MAG: hypothetical protein RL215_2424 [Planctomycetota bacterium]